MSHIDEFLENFNTTVPKKSDNDITTAWDCYTTASKSARIYRSARKSFSRIVSFAADLVADTEELKYREVLEGLTTVQWQVYRCSPLWNVPIKEKTIDRSKKSLDTSGNILKMMNSFESAYDEKALKRYARVITGYVATHIVSNEENAYSVEIVPMKGLRGIRSDKDALKVTVYSEMQDMKKTIFTGILCGIETAELKLKSDNCFNIPVFLTSGNIDTTERVIFGIEKCFDCIIAQLSLPNDELHWMLAMWAGLEVNSNENNDDDPDSVKNKRLAQRTSDNAVEEENITESKNPRQSQDVRKDVGYQEKVKMTYIIPKALSQDVGSKMKHITVSFPAVQLKKIWDNVHRGGDSEFTEQEMETFHTVLREAIMNNMGINTEMLDLIQITLPFFKAHNSGKIRIENASHVKVVLRYLTELCQGDMLQADPTLAASVQDNCTMEWA